VSFARSPASGSAPVALGTVGRGAAALGGASSGGQSGEADYRFRLTRSCSISSDVEMTRELAWKPR
jgi:hypothetical protein